MSVRKLLINGQPISLYEGVQLSQDYEIESAVSFKRTADGSLIRRAIWSGKIRTSITGKGLVPSGLSSFDFSAPYLLSCVAHRAVDSASNIITLPAARRSDVGSEPYALAFIGDEWKETGIASVVVNEYTITPVTGADLYKLYYFPEILSMSEPPSETKGSGSFSFGWQMIAREV